VAGYAGSVASRQEGPRNGAFLFLDDRVRFSCRGQPSRRLRSVGLRQAASRISLELDIPTYVCVCFDI